MQIEVAWMTVNFISVTTVINFTTPLRYNCKAKACDGNSLVKVKAMGKFVLSENGFSQGQGYKFAALGVIDKWGRRKGRKRLLGVSSTALLCITLCGSDLKNSLNGK